MVATHAEKDGSGLAEALFGHMQKLIALEHAYDPEKPLGIKAD